MLRKNLRYVNPFTRKIGYIGWLNHGNLGDEVMYDAVQKLLIGFKVLPFKYTKKMKYFSDITKNKIYDFVMLGGGTMIYDKYTLRMLEEAQSRNYKTFVFGTGAKSMAFWANTDVFSPIDYVEWKRCLEKCTYVGVRGPLSKQMLSENGFHNAEIIGDPAISLARERIKPKQHVKRIGINIGRSNQHVWGDEGSILSSIIEITNALLKDKWQVTFLPVWQEDVKYIEEAARKVNGKVQVFYEYAVVDKTMKFLESCDLFIGEKLHSVILATCAYTPSIMLEYRPKCLDFMMSMGLERFNFRTDSLKKGPIIETVRYLYDNLSIEQKNIYRKINYYKKLQKEKMDFIIKGLK